MKSSSSSHTRNRCSSTTSYEKPFCRVRLSIINIDRYSNATENTGVTVLLPENVQEIRLEKVFSREKEEEKYNSIIRAEE